MNKREWIDYVKMHVGKLDPVRAITKAMVAGSLDISYNTLCYNTYKYRPYELDDMASEEDVLININVAKGYPYVALTATPVPIDKVGSGVIKVKHPQFEDIEFYPAYLNEIKHILRSEVNGITSDVVYYTVQNNTIRFEKMPVDMHNTSLTVYYIKPFLALNEDDEVLVPKGQTNPLLLSTLQTLGYVVKEVTLNNNTDTSYGSTNKVE